MSVQPFLIGDGWMELKDGDESARTIFDRHYSRYVYADGRKPKLFVGPGEKMVLMRADGGAIFGWRKFISKDGQEGVNCNIFRRESGEPASEMLAEAEQLAWVRWPGERFYTYTDPRFVKPTMVKGPHGVLYPVWGYCFYRCGWVFVGVTKSGKIIQAREPAPLPDSALGAQRVVEGKDNVNSSKGPPK